MEHLGGVRKTAVIEAPCSPSTGDCQRFGPHGASITSRLWQGAAALHAPRHPAAGVGHGGRGGGLGVRAVGRAAARQQQVCPRRHFMIRAEDEMNRRVGESQSLVLFLSRNIGQVLGAAHPARQDPPAALPRGESKRPVVFGSYHDNIHKIKRRKYSGMPAGLAPTATQ
jgi:hypothetical protein